MTTQRHLSNVEVTTTLKSVFSSYHTMDDKVKYLLSLGAIRDRAKIVGEAARAGKLSNFDVHEERMDDVADFVTRIIKVSSISILFA